MSSKRRSSLRFWMEVNEVVSSVKLNKICSTEGPTFNLCTSLNHFMVLKNSEVETSHSRNVCNIESGLVQKLQLSSFLVMIILCSILNKNYPSLLSLVIWYILLNFLLQSRKLFGKCSFHFLIPVDSDTELPLNSL